MTETAQPVDQGETNPLEQGLGLRRIRHEVVRDDTPATRGAISKVGYLLDVAELDSGVNS